MRSGVFKLTLERAVGFARLLEAGDVGVLPFESAGFGGGQVVPGEVALGAVVTLVEPKFEVGRSEAFGRQIFQGDDIAEGFADFLPVDGQEVAVKPEVGEVFAVGAESLGDFVGVVDGDVVDATGVKVDGLA